MVLAAFVITFAAGLMVKYGLHGFTAAHLLNSWFLVAIALPVSYHLSHGHTNAWAQALAWLIGSALTIAFTANYAFYCAALAATVLIADDLPHPTDLADEGRRVLFTFAGVGIAVIVMLLAGLLQKRTAKTAPPAPAAPVHEGHAG